MNVEVWFQLASSIIVATMASTGFWKYMETRSTKVKMTNALLLGMAKNQIIDRGFDYIERGWITKDEYEDFVNDLYNPYKNFGGNGLGERVFKDVEALPVMGDKSKREKKHNESGTEITAIIQQEL